MKSARTGRALTRAGGRRAVAGRRPASVPDEPEPSTLLQDWRRRLPDATPLLLVGFGAFLLAVIARDWNEALAGGRLPLWSLFTAMGGVVFGGGVTVVVAGGDDFSEFRVPPCDPTARAQGSLWSSPWPVAAYDEGPVAGSVPSPTTAATAPVGPPRRRDSAGLEETIREVEATLDELLATSQTPTPPVPRTPAGPSRTRKAAPAPTGPAPATPTRATPAPPTAAPAPLPPVAPEKPPAARCIGCGATGATTILNETCTVCGEPMCTACNTKAWNEGHPLVCPNCDRLLFKPSGRR